MNSQDVHLCVAHDSIHDAVRRQDDLAYLCVRVLRNNSSRLREVMKPIDGMEQAADHDGGVVPRVNLYECVDGSEVRLRPVSPLNRDHAK